MEIIGNEIKQKLSNVFSCEKCQYITKRKSNYTNHLLSSKHKKTTNGNNFKQKLSKIKQDHNFQFICNFCEKQYKTSSGLWKHKQNCIKHQQDSLELNEPTDKELIMMLIKENNEMKNMMMEVLKHGTHNTTTNSHNKTFNLQVFLNEECKDAINMDDFINSIQVQIQDLEDTGHLGYVDGISKVVIKNLNALNVHSRPIHCSDSKREIIYIKDAEKWTKDNDNKDLIKNMIKQVAYKNIKQIPQWIKQHPNCNDSESTHNDKYLKIVSNSMSGSTEEEQRNNINKIISKIVKEITINKS
jgi:hypothetical protein